MSLLEDVFLQDEANEAAELERVIEGDEFEERRRSDSDENSEKEDEAEEDKRRVDPAKAKTTRVVKNPRFLLNPARLTGPRGIQVIPDHFKDFKFRGKGYEKEDLDLVLKRLEHWAYRLYPKFQFEDCLKKIEMLGKKRPVAVHLHKIRSDQLLSEDTVVQKDSSDEDTPMPEPDEFDKLLQQQIELARSTPAPKSTKKPDYNGSISPKDKRTTSLMMPKATSSPSINDEQRERMIRSRKLAEERRLARQKNAAITNNTTVIANSSSENTNVNSLERIIGNNELRIEGIEEFKDTDEVAKSKKHNRSNVIDSSDEENVETSVSITVDVHTTNNMTSKVVNKTSNTTNNNLTGILPIENEIDENINTDCNELNVSEINGVTSNKNSTEVDKDINMSQEKSINKVHNNSNNNSGENEELRYDDSDINIDLNEPNSDKNTEITDEINEDTVSEENSEVTNNINDIIEVDKPSSSIETNEENAISDNIPNEKIQDIKQNDKDKIENVPEDLIEDVMDVDFSEDF